MENTTLSKKEQLKLIDKAYYELELLNNIQWTHYRDELFELCKTEEKKHDRNRVNRGITVNEASKMFVVKRIAEYLLDEKRMPSMDSFIWCLQSCFYSASLVLNYRERIKKAWSELDIQSIASLDYSELVKA